MKSLAGARGIVRSGLGSCFDPDRLTLLVASVEFYKGTYQRSVAREPLRQCLVFCLPPGWPFPVFFTALCGSTFASGVNSFCLKDFLLTVLAFVLAHS